MSNLPLDTISTFVDDGILTVFSAVSSQNQSDVLDSSLLAQLGADKKSSRVTTPDVWTTSYQSFLGNLLWAAGSFEQSESVPPTTSFLVKDVILAGFALVCSAAEINLMRAQIVNFNRLPAGDDSVQVFQSVTQDENSVYLSMSLVTPSATIRSVGVIFRTTDPITRAFKQRFNTASLMSKVTTIVASNTLEEDRYAEIRANVIAKLGSKREKYILPVPAAEIGSDEEDEEPAQLIQP